MAISSDQVDGTDRRKSSRLLHDFAVVTAGYIAGHGVLRFFAAFLVGLNDAPRAALIERWIPLWNAVGYFLVAWAAFLLIGWLGGKATTSVKDSINQTLSDDSADVMMATSLQRETSRPEPLKNWKSRLKDLQKRKDVAAIVEFQELLAKSLPAERSAEIERRLGRWFTKHFQRVLMTGKAAESVDDVERVAAHYADSEEFAYFREILPVVRQCAELKQSILDEE